MNAILLSLIFGAVLPQFDAQTLDGRVVTGKLAELSADRAALETPQGRVDLDADNILSFTAKDTAVAEGKASVVVELADGSKIFASNYHAKDGKARITLPSGEAVEAPISAVQSVRLHGEKSQAEQWARLTETKADSDLLVVRSGETLDAHKGVINDVSAETVGFDLDGEILPVKRSKVYGFVYRHGEGDELPPMVCRITDSAGSRWTAKSVELKGNLELTTPAGLAVSMPLENVARMDFSCGKLAYLSDLEPESTAWTPFFGTKHKMPALQQFYAPRFDRGFDSGILALGGVSYQKGLALNARTELVYRLPDGYSRFRATAGIDDGVRPGGRVRLIIQGDGQTLLETDISGKDEPLPIELNIAGIRRLTVIVDYGEELSAGDRLLICNARIVK